MGIHILDSIPTEGGIPEPASRSESHGNSKAATSQADIQSKLLNIEGNFNDIGDLPEMRCTSGIPLDIKDGRSFEFGTAALSFAILSEICHFGRSSLIHKCGRTAIFRVM